MTGGIEPGVCGACSVSRTVVDVIREWTVLITTLVPVPMVVVYSGV